MTDIVTNDFSLQAIRVFKISSASWNLGQPAPLLYYNRKSVGCSPTSRGNDRRSDFELFPPSYALKFSRPASWNSVNLLHFRWWDPRMIQLRSIRTRHHFIHSKTPRCLKKCLPMCVPLSSLLCPLLPFSSSFLFILLIHLSSSLFLTLLLSNSLFSPILYSSSPFYIS